MADTTNRKITVTLDVEALEEARKLGIDVSAVVESALVQAVAEARRKKCNADNANAFADQSAWHEHHGHPLANIITSPGGSSWMS